MFYSSDLQRLTNINSFLTLTSDDFEWCCKYLLEKAGYGHLFRTNKGPKGGDGGIDLNIYGTDHKLIAYGQCKRLHGRYKGQGLMKPLRELCGCMHRDGVSRGIFLVTIESTSEEKFEAKRMGIEIIDAPALVLLAKKYALAQKKEISSLTAIQSIEIADVNQKQKRALAIRKIDRILTTTIGLMFIALGYVMFGFILLLLTLITMGLQGIKNSSAYKQNYRKRSRPFSYRVRQGRRYGYGF